MEFATQSERTLCTTDAKEQGIVFSVEIVNALENVAPHFSCPRTCCDSFIWRASVLVTLLQNITCYIPYQAGPSSRAV